METLTEEVNPNSRPAMEQPCLYTKPQVMASHGGRGDGGNWDGVGEQLPGQQGPSQKQDVKVQKLYKQDDKRDQELSEGEIDPELCHQEFERHQELSKWLNMRIQKLFQKENNSNKMFPQWEHSIDQELSKGEVRQYPELSEERGDSDKKESQEDLECIIIHTIWINPKYPQLLQDPDAAPQDSAKAAPSPALAEQVKAAGAQSQGPAPHSPCCPPGPSAPQPGAQALREQPAPPKKRPSRFRRALRALRALFCWPCLRPQPDNPCPLPAPGRAPQVAAGPEPARCHTGCL
ncbi:uncharacterized protein LOC128784404 [Vidua chalybeata]|uniref:uncharacterized protein LOC128784404 n=1 Tax=Vidua chalybeata TaxID=81927 RepID=UPI0023A900B2|nr:uncharacterized protein LOC128784404 [Vidua chalybeata]